MNKVWQAAGMVAVGLVLAAGCTAQKKMKTPACDAQAPGCQTKFPVFSKPVTDAMMQTPSTNYINERNIPPGIVQRDWPVSTTYYSPQVVLHGPLYFEDPFESVDHSVNPCNEGWSWVDYFAFGYSDARWLLNTVALPASMVVNPPWQAMCSDGIANRRLIDGRVDAAPCTQPVAKPFDLKCPDEQATVLAAEGQTPVVVEPTPTQHWAPATRPVR